MNWWEALPTLNEIKGKTDFMIAAISEVEVDTGNHFIKINFADNPHVAVSPLQKKLVYSQKRRTVDTLRLSIIGKILFFEDNEPLIFVGGGVLPILTNNEGDKYILCFGRDIVPFGYNAVSGLPVSWEEILNPRKIIFREFFEELMITSADRKIIFNFINEDLVGAESYEKYIPAHFKLWNIKPVKQETAWLSEYPLEDKWIVEIYYAGKLENRLINIVPCINPDTGTINLIKPLRIHINKDLRELLVFDCETQPYDNKSPLNRPIMAFDMNKIKSSTKYGEPAAIWWSGQNMTRIPLLHVAYDPIPLLHVVYDPIAAIRGI